MDEQVQDQDTTIAIRDLKTYIRKDREIEIEEQMIRDINSLPEQDALCQYIRNLRDKPRQVRATGKNQMDVMGVIITMDTLSCHSIKALIDSRCTGVTCRFRLRWDREPSRTDCQLPLYRAHRYQTSAPMLASHAAAGTNPPSEHNPHSRQLRRARTNGLGAARTSQVSCMFS